VIIKSLKGNILNVRYKGKVISTETTEGKIFTFKAADFIK
jgi:hypothetical protein